MIFDKITLHNFGLYEGTQSITLTPPIGNKPIILIGGLNGGGKTTFLDALQLALFGPHAKCSNRGSLAYHEYLSRCIHRGSDSDETRLEITFRHMVEGDEDSYHLRRSWSHSKSVCKERFDVLKNGRPEPSLADNWATQVEEFFPANIAHLFLFDGEQIEAYASQLDSSALIGSAIQNLLGLDMVDQLEKDLMVYERRKRSESKDNSYHAEINATQDIVHELRKRLDTLKEEYASLQTHRIDKLRHTLQKTEDDYRKIGGGLYDQKEAIEREWSYSVELVKDGENKLREFAAGAAPLLLVQTLLQSAEIRDRYEEKCRRAREFVSELKKRDEAALMFLRDHSADKNIINTFKRYFDTDRAEREMLGKKGSVLDITPEVRSELQALLRGDLPGLADKAAELLKSQSNYRIDEEQTRIEYASIPNTDTVEKIVSERDKLRHEIAEIETIHAAMSQSIEHQQRELERREQSLTRMIEADTKGKGRREDHFRILVHSVKVRKTLGTFRRAVIERHVRRIEQLVLESYHQLLRKDGLVTRLCIDPKDYALTLYGRDDLPLGAERLSAGVNANSLLLHYFGEWQRRLDVHCRQRLIHHWGDWIHFTGCI